MNSPDISRRGMLSTLGATGTLALAGCVGDDDNGDDNGVTEEEFDGLRVGFLGSFTGPNGPDFGHNGLTGFLSGLAYKDSPDTTPETNAALDIDGGADIADVHGEQLELSVGDTDVEVLVRDTADDPADAAIEATSLIQDESVDVLYGLSNSSSLERIAIEVIPNHDVPIFVGQASTSEVIQDPERCHRRLFRATETSAMSAKAGAEYIAQETDIGAVALFGADYSFGRSIIENYEIALQAAGIDVVDSRIEAVGHGDWRGAIEDAVDQGADALVYGFAVETGLPFFLDFTENEEGETDIPPLQVIGDMPPEGALNEIGAALDGLIAELEEDFGTEFALDDILDLVGYGPLTARYMWNQYDNPINDAFIEGQREAYSLNPDLFTSSAFASASAIVQATDEDGEVSSDAIVEQAYGMTVEDTPKGQGEYVFQEYNNQARSPITIAHLTESPPDSEFEEDQYWPSLLKPAGVDEDLWPDTIEEPPRVIDKDDVTLHEDEVECNLS